MTHSRAVTGAECVICDGPCREPLTWLPRIPESYPFLPPEVTAAVNAQHDAAEATTAPPPPAEDARQARGRRRRVDDRMRRPEHHDPHREDRS